MHSTSAFAERRLEHTPIAIVGMAGLFPRARSSSEYWQNIVDGTDCSSEVPADRWRAADYYDPDPTVPDKTYAKRGGFLPDIDFSPIEFGIPPNLLGVTSSLQTLSLLVARDLLLDAGAADSTWYDPARTGVVLGVVGCVGLMHPLAMRLSTPVLREVVRSCGLTEADAQEIADRYTKAFAPWEENSFPGLLANVTAGRIANRFNLGGMNCTVDAACAASLSAVRMAVAELADGRADMMITGGCDTENSIFTYMCFSKTGALAHSDRVRPFDQSADGTLLGEGIGMLALKRLADAERDGDRIYAVIRGIGSSSDGRAKSIYAPRAEGQHLALRRAYADAGVPISSVELFEAHATGTAVGDKTEISALTSVLDEFTTDRGYAAIGSVKSQIGHTKGAAGAASLMKAALALYHKVLPPTIGVDNPNDALTGGPLYLNTTARPWIRDPSRPDRRAGVSAMGFGGTNFHVVLQEHGDHVATTLHRHAQTYLWHAPDVAALVGMLRSGQAPATDPAPAQSPRIALVTVDPDRLAEMCDQAADLLEARVDTEQWSAPSGIYFRSRGILEPKVGALFAGQGSQYVNMGMALTLNNPEVRRSFDEAEAGGAGEGTRLSAAVFPPHDLSAQDAATAEDTLRRTELAQPAIGALAVGQFRLMRDLGLACEAYLGHSFGELTALWAAGALDDADYFRLAHARGQAMAPQRPDADSGAMAALQCSADEARTHLTDAPDVVICNYNAVDQMVVGGPTAQIDAVVARCRESGVTARKLPVSAAFHTPLVAHAVAEFRSAVKNVDMRAPARPVHANTSGAEYGPDVAANREILIGQLLNPVDFVAGLKAMTEESGCNVLVEFGPKQVLTQLARRTVPDEVVTIPVDSGPLGDSDVAFHRAVAQLMVLGVPLEQRADPPARVRAAEPGSASPGSVVLTGAEYVPESRRDAYAEAIGAEYLPERLATPADAAVAAPAEVRVDHPDTQVDAPSFAAGQVGATNGVEPAQHVADVLTRQTDLHERYLAGQLKIADELLTTLHDGDRHVLNGLVETIAAHSEAISNAHSTANNVLARLALAGLSNHTEPAVDLAGPDVIETDIVDTNGSAAAHQVENAAPSSAAADLAPPQAPAGLDGGPAADPAAGEPGGASGPAPVAAVLDEASLRATVVGLVADRTGYTVEMIDPGMDLEADLGVDSIKRVQIVSLVQERHPELPELGPEALAELRTIDQLVGHFAAGADAGTGAEADAGTAPPGPAAPAALGPLTVIPRYRLVPVALPPVDRRPEPYPSGRALAVVQLGPGAVDARALADHCGGQGWQVDRLVLDADPADPGTGWIGADWDDAALERQLEEFFAARPRLDACVLCVGEPADLGVGVRYLAEAVLVAKHAAARLAGAADGGDRAAFVTVTRIDGRLGEGTGPVAASRILGGLAGLTRTMAAEQPTLFCRALDVHPGVPAELLGHDVMTEMCDAAPGPHAVGLDAAGGRWTIEPALDEDTGALSASPALTAADVVLVTGGGRGVTATCIVALARAVPAEFILLGRTDVTDPLPEWSVGVDDTELAGAAIAHLSGGGTPPHPRAVAEACAQVRAHREIAHTVQAVSAAGVRVRYLSADVSDAQAVAGALGSDRDRISVVVHGAGALSDGLLARKSGGDLRRVFGPKLAGLDAVLRAVDPATLRQVVLFCSVAGVYGNSGQSDYAVANEAMSRWPIAQDPDGGPRVVAIAWGAWDGGMVTPDLRALFDSRGVPLLEPDAAAEAFVAEVTGRADSASVLLASPVPLHAQAPAADAGAYVACRDIGDLATDPMMLAHRFGGTVVLPAVYAVGWMVAVAEAAHPAHRVVSVDDFEVLRGITFDGREDRRHHVRLRTRLVSERELVVDASIGDGFPPPDGGDAKPGAPRYRAALTLSTGAVDEPGERADPALLAGTGALEREDGLQLYCDGVVFHGPRLQGIRTILERHEDLLRVGCRMPDSAVEHLGFGGRRYRPAPTDVVLQAALVLAAESGTVGWLPLRVDRFELRDKIPPGAPFLVSVRKVESGPNRMRMDAEVCSPDGAVLQRLMGITLLTSPGLDEKFMAGVQAWTSDDAAEENRVNA